MDNPLLLTASAISWSLKNSFDHNLCNMGLLFTHYLTVSKKNNQMHSIRRPRKPNMEWSRWPVAEM